MTYIYLALGLVGFSAITVQILLLRELINVFAGNELIYGLTLAIWLTLSAIGCLIGTKSTDRIKNKIKTFVFTQLVLALSIPSAILASRVIRNVFAIPAGITVDLGTTFLITTLIFALPCLILGFQFTLGSKILREKTQETPQQVGNMYILEAAGALIGGAVFSFLFIYIFNAFQIAGIVCCLLTLSSLSLYKNQVRKFAQRPLKAGSLMAFALVLAISIILIYPSGSQIDLATSKLFWQNYDLKDSKDSIYGRISVIKNNDSYSFFTNANLAFSTADTAINEELVHLPFLESPSPNKVLIIGGGFGGVLNEASKYKCSIDYIESDPVIFELSKRYLDIDALLKNNKIDLHVIDGRSFANSAISKYDIIIVNAGNPEDALTNRYYTLDFFLKCSSILNKNGIIAIALPASEGYMNREMKSLNSSIYKTLQTAFHYTVLIPSNRNYFFASQDTILTDKANQLINKWLKNNIRTTYFNSNTIPYIVYPFKIDSMKMSIKYDNATIINRDSHPISYFYATMLWASRFPAPAKNIMITLLKIRLLPLLIFIFSSALILKILSFKASGVKNSVLPLLIFLMGFIGMAGELMIIYAFQSFYGFIYSMIGILLALFMAGLALGSCLMNKELPMVKSSILNKIVLSLMALLTLMALYLTFVAEIQSFLPLFISQLILSSFILLLAMHVGAYFPAALQFFNRQSTGLTNTAGILYGCDLFGGAFASLATSIILIPLFGLLNVSIILLVISSSCFVLTIKS